MYRSRRLLSRYDRRRGSDGPRIITSIVSTHARPLPRRSASGGRFLLHADHVLSASTRTQSPSSITPSLARLYLQSLALLRLGRPVALPGHEASLRTFRRGRRHRGTIASAQQVLDVCRTQDAGGVCHALRVEGATRLLRSRRRGARRVNLSSGESASPTWQVSEQANPTSSKPDESREIVADIADAEETRPLLRLRSDPILRFLESAAINLLMSARLDRARPQARSTRAVALRVGAKATQRWPSRGSPTPSACFSRTMGSRPSRCPPTSRSKPPTACASAESRLP